MRWGSTDVQALTSFLDIDQRKKREKGGLGMDEEGGDCIRERKRKKRVHCGFTGGQKTSRNMSQV